MKENESKNEWTEQVFASLNDVTRAKMPADLTGKLLSKIQTTPRRIALLSQRTVWLVAAGVALLIGANLFSIIKSPKNDGQNVAGQNPVAQEYFANPSLI